ncbi:MAG: HAD family hydrolase [Spirochaetota bacterium]
MSHLHYKAVIFDLDGTLLYTLPDIARAVNHALQTKGLPPQPLEAYRQKVGWGLDETIRLALPEELQPSAADSGLLSELVEELISEYRRAPYELTTPYDGVPEMLSELRQRGAAVAVLSNKEHELTTIVVRELLPQIEFFAVQGVSASVPPKPDPTGVRQLLSAAPASPSEVLYVGDSGVDMQTALAAELYPLGVSWGYRPVQELRANGAQSILDRPEQLLDMFPDLLLDRM